jgi:anti-sigma factor RsiW
MDCRQAQSFLADLSVEHLPPASATELHSHLAQCPQCQDEWQRFQAMLLTLSTGTQSLPTQQQSQEMWSACLNKWTEQVERQRTTKEGVTQQTTAQRPSLWNWMRHQPRWGWAALGGAMAVFGGTWVLAPHDEPGPEPEPMTVIRFQTPPSTRASLVNHHSAMAFDPFSDHVGSTLVSYSATHSSPMALTP